VIKVKRVPSGVAVIARDVRAAVTGRDALRVQWSRDVRPGVSTELLRRLYRERLRRPGLLVEDRGDAAGTLASAARTLRAEYEVPYLAHAPMEPLNATVHVTRDACHIWTGTQYQSMDQAVAAAITGLPPERVHVHTTLLGGGFGRRASPDGDFVAEAVEVARGERVPVQTVWTREDDIRGGYYRPMFLHAVEAGLDASGRPIAWRQRLVGQSVARGTRLEPVMMAHGVDMASVLGTQLPYAIDHRRIECHNAPTTVRVSFWRSVGHSHTAFVAESFLDEIAHAGGRDPLTLRRELLHGERRHLAVLNLAAEKSGWDTPVPPGRARGLAVRQAFGTFVAQVADVSLDADGQPRVHAVTCAVDCGRAINPWNVTAQIEGAIVFGLSAALYGEISLQDGRVRQSNFHD
jgi:isoquinoline 1-oxidoreductase beta subunit